jgi:hypothetical protein
MSRPAARRLARSLWALTVASLAASFVLGALNLRSGVPDVGTELGFLVVFGVLTLAIATVGALVAARRPANAIGWVLVVGGLPMAASGVLEEYAVHALVADPGSLPAGDLAASVSDWIFVPPLFVISALLLLLFPDGRLPSARWRPAVWLTGAGAAALVAGEAFAPGRLTEAPFQEVTNPIGIAGAGSLTGALTLIGLAGMAAGVPVGAIAMVRRLRRARGAERQQLKWVASAAALFAVVCLIGVGAILAGDDFVSPTLIVLTFPGIPIAAGYAILRHRLFDIDLVINRALVYGALTALLAAAYLGSALLLGLALAPLTSGSDLAIALSTLAVAALFGPARRRVQAAVDRRFYRRKYDAERTLERFAARLRAETDLDALRLELTALVRETMQPAHVSLWVREQTP